MSNKIEIANNNILYTHSHIIKDYNQKYNHNLQIKLVDFCRLYSSGHVKTLSIYPDFISSYYIDLVQQPNELLVASDAFIEANSHNKKQHIHLLLPNKLSHNAAELFAQFSINNLFTITIHYENYSELFSFQHSGSTEDAISDYFNHLDHIKQSIAMLKSHYNELLESSDSDLIPLNKPAQQYVADHFEQVRTEKKLNVDLNNIWHNWQEEYSITNRESECFKLILAGLPIKKIASELNISPKTVESFIRKIRYKTNTFSKHNLTEKFNYLK